MKFNGSQRIEMLRALSEVPPIQETVCEWMEERGYSSRDIFCVGLAVEESLTNAVRHGNKYDSSKTVTISYHVSDSEVWIEVEDEGAGFQLQDIPDPREPDYLDRPGGRGVHCIREFMCHVQYHAPGNRVTMRKIRSHDNRSSNT